MIQIKDTCTTFSNRRPSLSENSVFSLKLALFQKYSFSFQSRRKEVDFEGARWKKGKKSNPRSGKLSRGRCEPEARAILTQGMSENAYSESLEK